MTRFLEANKHGLFSNVVTFTHPGKPSRVRLIPAIHVGEPSYYSAILDMIGKQYCLYELMESDESMDSLTKALIHEEDFNKIVEIVKNDKYFKVNREVFKEFLEKHAQENLKNLRDVFKELFKKFQESHLDEIFEIAEYNQYDVSTIFLLHRYMADFLEMSFQFKEIDYFNDVPKWKNWKNADIHPNEDGPGLSYEPVPLTHEVIDYFNNQLKIVLASLALYTSFWKIKKVRKRRKKFAIHLLEMNETLLQMNDKDLPDLLVNVRNQIAINKMKEMIEAGNDFNVFYGAIHLIAFEKFLSSEGFVPHESELVKIFGY
ncbi:MAG: hypothetical protein ACTSUE_14780 [Promethearchaeota archaeon]